MQWLKFERLRWDKGQPDTAEYHCEGCDAAIAEHHKTAMLAAGEWRATAEAAKIPAPSAITSRRSIRRSAGSAGRGSRGGDSVLRWLCCHFNPRGGFGFKGFLLSPDLIGCLVPVALTEP